MKKHYNISLIEEENLLNRDGVRVISAADAPDLHIYYNEENNHFFLPNYSELSFKELKKLLLASS
ncbi:hypothetical protein ABDD95_20535 [Mucilaginibacter sp. PAMB04274]|uniref:hypothetical protein n=1 Tax=Mucilaginibacter sp. PAMB04274 TaxID=3138568 RepID=UPI0031F660C1